jgi:hypothetical protein
MYTGGTSPTATRPSVWAWLGRPHRSGASARALTLMLLLGPGACTGSPGVLALQPAFDVTTPAGIASVSIRQAPPGITDAQFTEAVRAGMEQAAPGSVFTKPVGPPFPSRRIVWHVHPTASMGTSRLVVNVFNGSIPYAYDQEVIVNSAPVEDISSAIELLTKRLLYAVASEAKMPNRLGTQAKDRN